MRAKPSLHAVLWLERLRELHSSRSRCLSILLPTSLSCTIKGHGSASWRAVLAKRGPRCTISESSSWAAVDRRMWALAGCGREGPRRLATAEPASKPLLMDPPFETTDRSTAPRSVRLPPFGPSVVSQATNPSIPPANATRWWTAPRPRSRTRVADHPALGAPCKDVATAQETGEESPPHQSPVRGRTDFFRADKEMVRRGQEASGAVSPVPTLALPPPLSNRRPTTQTQPVSLSPPGHAGTEGGHDPRYCPTGERTTPPVGWQERGLPASWPQIIPHTRWWEGGVVTHAPAYVGGGGGSLRGARAFRLCPRRRPGAWGGGSRDGSAGACARTSVKGLF